MAVVAAGVHAAGRGGGVFGAARLQDRQGVHVGAKQNALVRALRRALRAVQDAEDAGLADALDDLVEAERPQALGDDARGARQIVGQLGVAVEIAPPFGELRDHGGDRVLQRGVHLSRLLRRDGCCDSEEPTVEGGRRFGKSRASYISVEEIRAASGRAGRRPQQRRFA